MSAWGPAEWATLVGSVLTVAVGGIGAWMFKIDRNATSINEKMNTATDAIGGLRDEFKEFRKDRHDDAVELWRAHHEDVATAAREREALKVQVVRLESDMAMGARDRTELKERILNLEVALSKSRQ